VTFLPLLVNKCQNKAIPQSQFIDAWKERVGEQFSNLCDLELLDVSGSELEHRARPISLRPFFEPSDLPAHIQGLYILTPGKGPQATTIMYFCASELSLDPASRFSELFSVKPKWRMDEVAPFLLDLAVDDKKRDALTLKFTRKFKGDDGHVYYTARGK
jgi:sister chromatid cohesion protein DCC1